MGEPTSCWPDRQKWQSFWNDASSRADYRGPQDWKERRTPLAYIPEEQGKWLIVAAYAGAVENPAWYYNLAAYPDRVSIELDGNLYQVAVEELHGNQRDLAWKRITQANSRFAGYQKKTDRELPVIRLTTRD